MFPPVTGMRVVGPDHAAQHMQRGVGAHQPVPAVPVDPSLDFGPHVGKVTVDRVPDRSPFATYAGDRERPRRSGDLAEVTGLPASAGIERGPCQPDPAAVAVDLGDGGVEYVAIGIDREQLGGGQLRRWRVGPGDCHVLVLAEVPGRCRVRAAVGSRDPDGLGVDLHPQRWAGRRHGGAVAVAGRGDDLDGVCRSVDGAGGPAVGLLGVVAGLAEPLAVVGGRPAALRVRPEGGRGAGSARCTRGCGSAGRAGAGTRRACPRRAAPGCPWRPAHRSGDAGRGGVPSRRRPPRRAPRSTRAAGRRAAHRALRPSRSRPGRPAARCRAPRRGSSTAVASRPRPDAGLRRTRSTRMSAMIAPRDRSSPAAFCRVASSRSALWTATPSLTGSSAPSHVMVSGAGRRLVCRSASARRLRSATDAGVEPSGEVLAGRDDFPVAHGLELVEVAGDRLVDELTMRQRQAGGLPSDQGRLPLGDPARPAAPRGCRSARVATSWPAPRLAARGRVTHAWPARSVPPLRDRASRSARLGARRPPAGTARSPRSPRPGRPARRT